ncbi:hypothetical protein OF83DRAFT_1087917 [Amylostereum chailletii]|nr:hypothetical protein OF83DRAFT_1087917 [Amylostereum chailletii]
MSGGLTHDQVQLVRDWLSGVITARVFPMILETALFAIFTVLFGISTGILVSKGLRTRPNPAMFTLTLVMYTASAALLAVDIKIMRNELTVLLPELLSPEGEVNIDVVDIVHRLDNAWIFTTDVLSQLNIVLSDAVVVWRACVVWNRRKDVTSVAVAILVCMLGINVVYLLAAAALRLPSQPRSILTLSKASDPISTALYSLTIFANVWATSIIACKAWIHRRDIHRHLQNRTTKSVVESILMLLVESGAIYSIFLVLLMLETFSSVPVLYSGPFLYYWDPVMNQVSGMYPTLIVVLVALKKSHCEHQFSYANKGPESTTLPFSVRVPQEMATIIPEEALEAGTAQDTERDSIYASQPSTLAGPGVDSRKEKNIDVEM